MRVALGCSLRRRPHVSVHGPMQCVPLAGELKRPRHIGNSDSLLGVITNSCMEKDDDTHDFGGCRRAYIAKP